MTPVTLWLTKLDSGEDAVFSLLLVLHVTPENSHDTSEAVSHGKPVQSQLTLPGFCPLEQKYRDMGSAAVPRQGTEALSGVLWLPLAPRSKSFS